MLRRDWVRLVTGTLVGIVFLTADLVGIGAAPGFGWKQIVGTLAALVLVAPRRVAHLPQHPPGRPVRPGRRAR